MKIRKAIEKNNIMYNKIMDKEIYFVNYLQTYR